MIETLAYIALGLGVLAALVLAFAATRPDTFQISRSTRVAAPPEAIFPLINDLRAFATWSPFETKDPDMARRFSGPESGPGQRYDWQGDSNVGTGWLVIADAAAPERVEIDLNMLKPMRVANRVTFTLVPEAGGGPAASTVVTWAMQGGVPLMAKVLHLFVDMDRMCGDDFTTGLASLKALAERSAAPAGS